jgi:hypothetical protein
VAEQLLDVPDVGAAAQQMRGAGVAELVRRQGLRDLRAAGVYQDERLDALDRQPRAVPGKPERRFVRGLPPARSAGSSPPRIHPFKQSACEDFELSP